MSTIMAKGPEAPKASGGGGGAADKAKKAVESAIGMLELAAPTVVPFALVGVELSRRIVEAGTMTLSQAYWLGTLYAFIGIFGWEMLKNIMGKLGSGG